MLFVNQLSLGLDCSTGHTEDQNSNPARDQSTVGANDPGQLTSVDRHPNPSVYDIWTRPVLTGFWSNCRHLLLPIIKSLYHHWIVSVFFGKPDSRRRSVRIPADPSIPYFITNASMIVSRSYKT